MIREAKKEDLEALLELYLYLHEDSIPKHDEHLEKIWNQIIEDPNHHLIVNEIDGQIIFILQLSAKRACKKHITRIQEQYRFTIILKRCFLQGLKTASSICNC